VLGGARERDVEGGGEFADRARLPGEVTQHGAARGIGEGAEDGVETFWGFINHGVEYKPAQNNVNC